MDTSTAAPGLIASDRLGGSDNKSQSWFKTPDEIANLGGCCLGNGATGGVFLGANTSLCSYKARGSGDWEYRLELRTASFSAPGFALHARSYCFGLRSAIGPGCRCSVCWRR